MKIMFYEQPERLEENMGDQFVSFIIKAHQT
jgi:hypothetical protein